jgi:hypothetical protein
MEMIMWCRFSMVAAAAFMFSGTDAITTELPTYEVMSFPITQHQLAT